MMAEDGAVEAKVVELLGAVLDAIDVAPFGCHEMEVVMVEITALMKPAIEVGV